ncbi:MAG: peptidoglycan DD-metalloendopeptidase family protein, partial [Chloroflexota bacterium]|nr:peptidoglycan DD-metalloendopeptidase family protein [Chloroflexota bacterium]
MSRMITYVRRICVLSVCATLFLSLLPAIASPAVAGGGIVLRPPFNGTYRLTSYFDHYEPTYGNDPDGDVTIYTGETTDSCDPYCYRGHNGIDWAMPTGTDVLASAAGIIELIQDPGDTGYGCLARLDHGNGYKTLYGHIDRRWDSGQNRWVCDFVVGEGDSVQAGTVLGDSGNTRISSGPHLHFTVYHNDYPSDPFGWRGSEEDPLVDYSGETASCLWAGVPGDDISCADIIVEDDGEGWTESGTWFDSINGNGYREHHTYSWDPPPSAEAYWMPTLPAKGFYRVYAFVPPISSRTTHAHYVIDNGTTQYQVYRDQSGTAPRWMSLGTFEFPAGFYGWINLDDYTTEPKYSHWVAADSIKFSAITVYLPDVKDRYNWVSSIVIRNNSASSAQVGINYYDSSGGLVSYQTATIAANGSKTKTPPSDFSGSAVVVGDQDVAVVVEQIKGTTRYRYAYTGQAAPATTLYLPQAIHDLGSSDEWHTNIWGLNAGPATTDITTRFYNDLGSTQGTESLDDVAPNGSGKVDHSGLPNQYYGAGRTSASQPLASVVQVSDSSIYRRLGYSGLAAGDDRVWLPFVMTRLGNDWGATIWVHNTTDTQTSVSMNLYGAPGFANGSCDSQSLPGKGTVLFNLRTDHCGLGWGWYGSALASANQPVAVVVNQLRDAYPARGDSYEGIPDSAASQTVILPRVVRGYSNRYYSNFTVHDAG